MSTKLELQDERYKGIGFHPEKDFPYPKLSKDEWQLFLNLRDATKALNDKNELVILLSQCQIPYEITKVYQRSDKSEFKQVLARLRTTSSLPLPDSAIFDKLDLRFILEGFIDWIAIDGGEIRQDKTYEEDGNTVKEEWVRLYWK